MFFFLYEFEIFTNNLEQIGYFNTPKIFRGILAMQYCIENNNMVNNWIHNNKFMVLLSSINEKYQNSSAMSKRNHYFIRFFENFENHLQSTYKNKGSYFLRWPAINFNVFFIESPLRYKMNKIKRLLARVWIPLNNSIIITINKSKRQLHNV